MYRTKDIENLKGKRQASDKGRLARITPDISMIPLKAQRAWTDMLQAMVLFSVQSCSVPVQVDRVSVILSPAVLRRHHSTALLSSSYNLTILSTTMYIPFALGCGKSMIWMFPLRPSTQQLQAHHTLSICEFLYCFLLWKEAFDECW